MLCYAMLCYAMLCYANSDAMVIQQYKSQLSPSDTISDFSTLSNTGVTGFHLCLLKMLHYMRH